MLGIAHYHNQVIIIKKIFFLRSKIFILNHHKMLFYLSLSSQKTPRVIRIQETRESRKIIIFLLNFLPLLNLSKARFLFYFLLTFFPRWYSARENHHKSGCYLSFIISILYEIIFPPLQLIQTQSPPPIFLLRQILFCCCVWGFQLLTESLQNTMHTSNISIASYGSNDASNGLRSIRESESSS